MSSATFKAYKPRYNQKEGAAPGLDLPGIIPMHPEAAIVATCGARNLMHLQAVQEIIVRFLRNSIVFFVIIGYHSIVSFIG